MQKIKNSKVSVFIKVLLLFVVLYGCSAQSKRNLRNNLAFELCEIYGIDQGIRQDGIVIDKKSNIKIDSLNFQRVMNFINKNGYPNKDNIGTYINEKCVQAAAIVVLLHNPQHIVNNKEYRDLLIKEVKKGNMKEETLLLIMDKYYWHISKGKKVYMGSKFGKPCIKDRAKSDSLRKAISLLPLKTEDFKNCEE